MVSSDSDSESEYFESAEESVDEVEEIEGKKRSREGEGEVTESIILQNDQIGETITSEEVCATSLSYRRRPERMKRTPCITSPKIIPKCKKSNESVFKTDGTDVFLQDITSNLSKNINKSLHTLQQTSSNVKDLILNSLPASAACEKEGFVYDDTLNTPVEPVDELILNKTVFGETNITNDHLNDSRKGGLINSDEVENLSKRPIFQENSEMIPENNIIKECTTETSVLETYHLQEHEIDQKILEPNSLKLVAFAENVSDDVLETYANNDKNEKLENSSKCLSNYQGSEGSKLNKIIFDTSQNGAISGQPSVTVSLQDQVNDSQLEFEDLINIKDSESNVPGKIISPHVVCESESVTFNSQNEDYSDILTGPERFLDLENQMAELHTDCNATPEEGEKKKKGNFITDLDKNEKRTEKSNRSLSDTKTDSIKIKDRKNSSSLKINAQLKLDKDILTEEKKEEEEMIHRGTGHIDKTPEKDFNVKGSNKTHEKLTDGWEDFDFSDDKEIEVFEDVNESSKSGKTKHDMVKVKNQVIFNSVEDKTDISCKGENLSNVVCLEKPPKEDNVVDGTKEGKGISEEKSFEDESWGWEDWGNETLSTEEKKGKSKHERTFKNDDQTQNIPDDGSKWSGWDTFSQKMEEKQGNWNIGSWGVNLLLNKATAVTQGISNVFEVGLGVPDAETFARMQKEEEKQVKLEMEKMKCDELPEELPKKNSLTSVNLFPVSGITNLVAGVTSKIVEHTKIQEIGSKVLTGGLDTLETFGKKTMEVLQDGDPGLRSKRALLMGNNKPVLSQILREAREKADKEMKEAEEKALARKCHFEILFDDFQGMVHLEALEMLSRQFELKLEQAKCGMSPEEVEDLEGIVEEVEQLCNLDDLDTNSLLLDFKTLLQVTVEPLKDEISIEKIIQIHENVNKWLKTSSESDSSLIALHQKAVSTLAELTAAVVHEFHKAGELLPIKEWRKTLDEIEALAKLTNIFCVEINRVCEKFISIAKSKSSEELDSANNIKEKIIVMRNNSTSYIKQAFNLLIPVLQAGAAL